MKPLGRRCYKSFNGNGKEDLHFKRIGRKNWWEVVIPSNKKKDINYYKKLLKDELNNINEEEFKKLYIGVWN